jgi:hypothetical protein
MAGVDRSGRRIEAEKTMTDWVVNRWKRYGHDRLYAETPGGTRLGYLDLKSNELHPAGSGDLALLTAAVAGHLSESNPADGRRAGAELVTAQAVSGQTGGIYTGRHEVVDWQDLGSNAPGTAVRDRAIAERTAAPIRTVLSRILGVHTQERAWRIGADGEQAVAAQLVRLGQAWRVIHSVPVGEQGADIDHVVIGPAGVFTVNAKHHPNGSVWVGADTFLVNGTRTWYVRNSRHEAARASRLLTAASGQPVQVRAIIAVVGAHRGLTIKEQPRDGAVHVVTRKMIADYLRDLPTVLDPATVAALHTLACRSTTWRPS